MATFLASSSQNRSRSVPSCKLDEPFISAPNSSRCNNSRPMSSVSASPIPPPGLWMAPSRLSNVSSSSSNSICSSPSPSPPPTRSHKSWNNDDFKSNDISVQNNTFTSAYRIPTDLPPHLFSAYSNVMQSLKVLQTETIQALSESKLSAEQEARQQFESEKNSALRELEWNKVQQEHELTITKSRVEVLEKELNQQNLRSETLNKEVETLKRALAESRENAIPTKESASHLNAVQLGDLVRKLHDALRTLEQVRSEISLCTICMERGRSVIFLPCRHEVTCQTCAGMTSSCPLCRGEILDRIVPFRN